LLQVFFAKISESFGFGWVTNLLLKSYRINYLKKI